MTQVRQDPVGQSSADDLVTRLAAGGPLVSPVDDAHRQARPLADRPASVDGLRVALLDIAKNRGAEFLDRLEAGLQAQGATTTRLRKEIFSKPAAPEVLRRCLDEADAVVQALAD